MSESQEIEGSRVYCHICDHEWDHARGELRCPRCESDFVEIVVPASITRSDSPPPIPPHPHSSVPPRLSHPFHDHNPWGAPDPEEDDITTFEFNSGGGRGTFSFSSRTYTFGGGNLPSREPAAAEIHNNFEAMLGNIMGFGGHMQPGGPRRIYGTQNIHDRGFGTLPPGHPPDLFSTMFPTPGQPRSDYATPPGLSTAFELLSGFLNPTSGRRGDTVFSQEAFDRVMTQLMEQNSSGAPGPATDSAIANLRKKSVDAEMLGVEGKAECSICMDNLQLGEEVTVLPCNHWFHGSCVISWLREHDTCPHCRKPISNTENPDTNTNRPSSSRRRRSSRRSSSIASPLNPVGEDSNGQYADTPTGLREARQRYYGRPRSSEFDSNRPPNERRSSHRSQHSPDRGGNSGGVTGWIRDRLPFSGQQ